MATESFPLADATSDPLVGGGDTPPVEPGPGERKRLTKWQLYSRRFVRNRPAVAGIVIFVLLVAFALVGPLFAKYDHVELDFLALSDPPNPDHWFGTNNAGNDLYAMVVVGLQRSLLIAVVVATGTTILSAVIGTAAAYFGGRIERFALFVIHFLMVAPTFLLLAMMSNDSGGDWKVIALVLILVSWFFQARTIWTLSLSLREREYVHAARYMGVPGMRIVLRHLIPNIGSLLVINFTLGVVGAVMAETGLSFLGFGVKLPDVSLGSLIGIGASSMSSAPWMFYFPAAALTLLTVSMALVADGLRDALDPTSAAGGRA
ncbi:ABC transporter permease [Isoptericola sp. NEAU-Y5]|uniref:Oligopeptide transport system permease protein OppC n=1 Tax=Isoptericola luteus TaxID=2879484 RepID=A0ABS7ZHP8_9MICO|nr:ABC transporter permease [Isoptericola sp. NEAU-Y5]MCA5893124.1 ABC transporter permease [Isoptericola sp. NEAU-Y5]